MLSRYGILVFEAAIKARALTRPTPTAAKAMMADGIQPPPAMMAKIVSVVVLECVGEAHKTGKDKQGAVGGEGNKGRGRDSLYIYVARNNTNFTPKHADVNIITYVPIYPLYKFFRYMQHILIYKPAKILYYLFAAW